eukprot:TRINITY_DN4869_c0_g1_i1.p1 TRINITY_DN4869_c0_g1~~TRINITY_DN4869_c0_g1_i1.p1  ORF type:complete len:254 (-),score=46.56 TRINITY_DN4869_c0_g1_i1:341-1102(-)
MATLKFNPTSSAVATFRFDNGMRALAPLNHSTSPLSINFRRRSSSSLVVRAATAVAPKFTTLKPLGERVLVKLKEQEEKTPAGILLPSTAQTKPQSGEVVATAEKKKLAKTEVPLSVKLGEKVVYSKYAGTEVEMNGNSHLLLKEDDVIGVLDTDDIKDLKPLNDRVLVKLAEAERKTAGGVLLSESAKERPSIGTVVAVGPGAYDEEGKRKPMPVSPGNSVLISKYAGNEFKSGDGTDYMTLRVGDILAILS